MMNIDNIRKTIKTLEDSNTYDQGCYMHGCGTPACIAGHAVIDAGYTFKPGSYSCYRNGHSRPVAAVAAEWFGIIPDSTETERMFRGAPFGFGINRIQDRPITKEQAIAMLENFIETGEVDWVTS